MVAPSSSPVLAAGSGRRGRPRCRSRRGSGRSPARGSGRRRRRRAGAGWARPDLDQLVGPDVWRLRRELADQRVPAAGRPAELVLLDRLVGEAAAAQVVERRLARLRAASGPRGRRRSPLSRTSRRRAVAGVLAAWSARRAPRRPCAARTLSASGNARPSRSITNVKMSPPLPQPKQCHVSRAGVTTKTGVFSPWNGHSPLRVVPGLLQLDRLPDDVGDAEPALDLGCNADRQTDLPARTRGPSPPRVRPRAIRVLAPPTTTRTWIGACQVLTSRIREE